MLSRDDLRWSGRLTGRYFEDFQMGERFETAGRTLFEADISNFIGAVGIYEELYTNAEYIAEKSLFGRRFAPGPLTFSLAEGLVIQTGMFNQTGLALLEVQMRFVAPLFVGDTIRVTVEVTEKRETSRVDRGIVKFNHAVVKSSGESVLLLEKTRMIRCRPLNED